MAKTYKYRDYAEYQREYQRRYRAKKKEEKAQYYIDNKEEIDSKLKEKQQAKVERRKLNYQNNKEEKTNYQREWQKNNKDKVKSYHSGDLTTDNGIKNKIKSLRKRAFGKGLDFNLTIEDFKILPTHCPVLGIEINYTNKGKPQDNSPSVDRIDNTKGYTSDNIIIICYRANRLKNDASIEEIEKIYDFYKKFK
jgi:hypothetical protein